jgi:hypothetical protein
MKRCTRTMLLFAGLMLAYAPCAFAAPESAASPVSAAPAPAPESAPAGPEGAPSFDTSPAPEALSAAEREAALAGAEDFNAVDAASLPAKRLTLEERLSLENAVCALWHNAQKQEPAPVESLDIMTLEAPDHVFVQGYYFAHEGWVFEGIIRHMVPDSTGIEVISRIQNYRVQFQRLENGGFKVVSAVFSEVGMG